MSTLEISLPDSLQVFVDEQVSTGAYRSAGDYVQALIRAEERRAIRVQLEQKLLEALECGDFHDNTPDLFARLRSWIPEERAEK